MKLSDELFIEIVNQQSKSNSSITKIEKLKKQIDEMELIVKRLDESINWIDIQLSNLATNDKDRYINFEWLKSHFLSIKYNENRESIKGEQK